MAYQAARWVATRRTRFTTTPNGERERAKRDHDAERLHCDREQRYKIAPGLPEGVAHDALTRIAHDRHRLVHRHAEGALVAV
jgi:hypothetical protein